MMRFETDLQAVRASPANGEIGLSASRWALAEAAIVADISAAVEEDLDSGDEFSDEFSDEFNVYGLAPTARIPNRFCIAIACVHSRTPTLVQPATLRVTSSECPHTHTPNRCGSVFTRRISVCKTSRNLFGKQTRKLTIY